MNTGRLQQVSPHPVPGDLPIPPRSEPAPPAPIEEPEEMPPPPRQDPDVVDPGPSPGTPPMIA